jgi:hypothetical protein
MYNTSHLKDERRCRLLHLPILPLRQLETIPCHYELTFATILHKTLLKTKAGGTKLKSKDTDVVADALLLVLSYAFSNPSNVADFLFIGQF